MAWEDLNRRWQEDRSIRISLLREQSERPRVCAHGRVGNAYTLQHKSCLRAFHGQLWSEGDNWCFQESGTGFSVTAPREPMSSAGADFHRRDRQLVAAMNAEYERRRQQARRRMRVEASKADQPKTPGDMGIKGVSRDGKKIYTWGDRERGQIKVAATPRALRKEAQGVG